MIWGLFILFIIQLFFAWMYRYRGYEPEFYIDNDKLYPEITVLICAKNEANNIATHLPKILEQDYPGIWKVLVVNDASNDDTAQVLNKLKTVYPKLNILEIDQDADRIFPGKKYALYQGLKSISSDIVLLTDADCYPKSSYWILGMAKTYLSKAEKSDNQEVFVLGYGAYETKPGLLNHFIRWETLHTFIQYASWAKNGFPYMGVGRNLMYHKKQVLHLLEKDAAFKEQFVLTNSGDDDLIISKLANIENTIVCDTPLAHTLSKPSLSWSAWWQQKTRHVSSGKYYSYLVKFGLSMYAMTAFLFWLLALILLFRIPDFIGQISLLLLTIRVVAFWGNGVHWAKRLEEKGINSFYPLGEILWAIYNLVVSPFIFWKNKKKWK
ncbi:MAG TPA: glycosyltransferase [Edaphocola sp.]|nr:glycosyltransferase [Edaphocola sp.]